MWNEYKQMDPTVRVFHPYRWVMGFAVSLALIAVMGFLLAAVVPLVRDKLFYICLGTFVACTTIPFFRYPKVVIMIGEQGITLHNIKNRDSFYADWSQFTAAYYIFIHRASFLLLMPYKIEPATKKELLSALNRVTASHQLSLNGCAYIPLVFCEKEVIQMVAKKIPVLKRTD